MMNKSDLYKLVDSLPDTEIPTAAAFLSFVTLRAKQTPFDSSHRAEHEKKHFMAEVQAGIEEMDRGEGIPHEEVMKNLAPWLES